MIKTREQAAQERSLGVRALADRPRQRRCAQEPTSGSRVAIRSQITLRESAGSGPLAFDGYASMTERGYEMWDWYGPYVEVVTAGAFEQTLNRGDLDVPLVLQHDQLRRIARTTNGTLRLSEDDQGLRVLADLDPSDLDVAYIAPKLRAGLIDEMSFAFRIEAGQWSPDYSEYRIDRVDIHRGDVAIVGFGANPYTVADLVEAAKQAPDESARAALAALNLRFMRAVEEPLMQRI